MMQFAALKTAIEDNIRDGDTFVFEGFTHLVPHAAAQEVIRQALKDLTLIRMTPDIVYDQMSVGNSCARAFSNGQKTSPRGDVYWTRPRHRACARGS
jgi:acyl CoA:acetate/3-ketoacid CoA transferase alpha subunit